MEDKRVQGKRGRSLSGDALLQQESSPKRMHISEYDAKCLLQDAQNYHEIMEQGALMSQAELDKKCQQGMEMMMGESKHPPERKVALTYLLSLSDLNRKQFFKILQKKVKKSRPVPPPRKPRAKKASALTDEQKAVVGRLFDAQSTTGLSPPHFIRVVGWNRTGKSVLVETVPSTPHVDDGLQGGSCKIDSKWLSDHLLGQEVIRDDYFPATDGQPEKRYRLGTYKSGVEKDGVTPFEQVKVRGHYETHYPMDDGDMNRTYSWCCD